MISMNSDEGEKHIIERMEKIKETVDKKLRESLHIRRKLIGTFFIKEFTAEHKKIPNPIWDIKAYQAFAGEEEKVRLITAETALFFTHRAIINSKMGTELIPYDPMERTIVKKDAELFFHIWLFGINYMIDQALLRQLRKGIVWKTIVGEDDVVLNTDFDETNISEGKLYIYKSNVKIPETLNKGIKLYEERKSEYMLYSWSLDVGSYNLENLISLYSYHFEEIEKYYGCPIICIFSFFYALSDLCELLLNHPDYETNIGTLFSKRALLDKLSKEEDYGWNTRFENGLSVCETILPKIDGSLKKHIFSNSYDICENILDKYAVSFRNLRDLNEFLTTPSLLYEIEPNCILLLNYFFKQVGASLLEKPLITSGEWIEYKGKAFESHCHRIIKSKHGLKTFRKKIKDEHGIDLGDIDLGVLRAPFIFACDCKNYAINTKLISGEVYPILDRIQDSENGYLGWLSKIDKLCSTITSEDINEILRSNQLSPEHFQYIVPIIIVWRPEFILDIRKNMLNDEIPRVCTIFEFNNFLEKIPNDLSEKEFVIKIT